MKKITGIVCEYNPFHKGHEYHINETRKGYGDDTIIICCMSGDFVQRGEWAIMPKHIRAAAAVRGGADIVVELPVPWSLSSAEGFAEGAVSILSELGIDTISFGSESGDTSGIISAAETISAPGFNEKVSEIMRKNPKITYPAARANAAENEILGKPNDNLGTEYVKAILKKKMDIDVLAIKRIGSAHDGPGSAAELREMIRRTRQPGAYADDDILNIAAVSRLRMFSRDYYSQIADTDNGAGNRLYDAVREGHSTVDEICLAAKTKSLTFSRMKRIAMRAVLGIKHELTDNAPPYARILASSAAGREYIASVRKNEKGIPVVSQSGDVKKIGYYARQIFDICASAEDFYYLGMLKSPENAYKCGDDYRISPVIGE